MSELKQLKGTNNMNVACPSGHRIRIVSVLCTLTGIQVNDEIVLTFARTLNVNVVISAYVNAHAGIFSLSAYPGAQINPPSIDTINQVTGVVTYLTNVNTAMVAIPDVWFDWDVLVALATSNGSSTAMLILYEERRSKATG